MYTIGGPAAVALVCATLFVLGAGPLAATFVTRERVWALLSLPLALAAGRYWTAVRWTDHHGRWPEKSA
jgi:hypothetical protein